MPQPISFSRDGYAYYSESMMFVIAVGFFLCCSTIVRAEKVNAEIKPVSYEDFGARGDGKTDDLEAIVKAHEFANERGYPVKAASGANYYIGGAARTAVIQTDTDFGDASFVIDDTRLENRGSWVFVVKSKLPSVDLEGVKSLKKGQSKIDAVLSRPCVVVAYNDKVKRYIRYGSNQNSGKAQRDVFLVGRDGKVDPGTPILWDFDEISKITANPVDETQLTVKGGVFTTIANRMESKYTYHSRGISVRRSNVLIEDLEHHIAEEGDQGAPYSGFINISQCANVTVRNCKFSGHKTYRTIGSAGRPVSMGTYDIQVNSGMNVSFINCTQINDINDGKRWGIMASNFSKNLVYEGCRLSRFDAHMGVANATIKNSTIGHAGINAIGSGVLLLEDSTFYGRSIINLRPDYGSTWQGEFIIRNCVFVPRQRGASLITGSYSGKHDFGYQCYMPARVTFEKLRIDDKKHGSGALTIFSDFNSEFKNTAYKEKYPYIKTEEVILKDIDVASGASLSLSPNKFMFKDVKVTRQ